MRILMAPVRPSISVAVLAAALGLTACSSSTSQPAASATITVTATASPSPTAAENLVLTDAVREQLVAAAARLNSLQPSDYLGLVKGESYYGFDPATNTYWAGGALDPSPTSQQAQVSVQDDGGYYIFQKPANGSWTASAEGLAGIEGAKCSVTIPPALVALWHWSPGACHPAGI